MIRSIYTKNILNYFFVIIVSLILSFVITFFLFQNQVTQNREAEVIEQGKAIIHLYQRLDKSGFNEYLNSLSSLPYDVYIYNQNGLASKSPQAAKKRELNRKNIDYVLDGGVYRNISGRHHMSVGLPFDIKNEPYALFITPSLKEQFSQIRSIILTALFLVLLLGISLILVTTKFLVRPLAHITNATRQLARGNFQVRLHVKSKDEIGQLAKSFNFMVEELEKTEQMRKDFVANVSHELQSPLTAIKGMVIALKDGVVDHSEQKRYFGLMEQESDRLSSLTKQLLNLSILEAGKSPFHPKRFRLDRQMRNQLVALQPLWAEKQLDVDFDLPNIEIFADEGLLNQVWTNLYVNAIKYNWQNGKITVQGYDFEDEIEVVISNTGQGIPIEDLPYIFERFYRVEKAHTRAAESYGLGLAVAKRIIELHNGEISVTSTEGQETTFKIRIAQNSKRRVHDEKR
ncbi:histidine kinase [Neobacillus bataviensis LMG 21833]|uniref:Heme sensor protein HssS n=1 Tax=Neobacillus bataviensis LMG 21833 TaxID=1117379 RepID=K6DCA8_9BACI|nr:ATP-binding protein [Neobacillus bataviensis]EKN65934.1 histidine kinase [Neobacillus bataviensis LMG 21833]